MVGRSRIYVVTAGTLIILPAVILFYKSILMAEHSNRTTFLLFIPILLGMAMIIVKYNRDWYDKI